MDDDITAKVSSRGQVTIPKPIRDALAITGGEEVTFRLHRRRVLLATDEESLELTERTVVVTAPVQPAPWDARRRSLLASRAKPQVPGTPISEEPEPEITVDLRTVVDAEVDDGS